MGHMEATLQSFFSTSQALQAQVASLCAAQNRPTRDPYSQHPPLSAWVSVMSPRQAGPKETSTKSCFHLP